MKHILAVVLLSLVSFSYTFAEETTVSEEKTSMEMKDREVIPYNFELKINVENGSAYATWNDFPNNRGFEWYKLVYSTSNTQPVYPTDDTVFIWERLQLKTSFKLKQDSKYHYVRLCAIVVNDDYSKDRYCSEVKKLELTEKNRASGEVKKEELKTEVKKEETKTSEMSESVKEKIQKYNENKQKESTWETKSEIKKKLESTFTLSLALRQRINVLLKSFVDRLKEQDFSNEKISSSIDVVIERLWKFEGQEKYKNIVGYMIQELESMKELYSDPLSELEGIFNDF